MALTRDQILAAQDLRLEKIQVPEWGGEVLIRSMTSRERDAFEAHFAEHPGSARYENIRARLAATCVCDEASNPIFTEDDIQALGAKSAAALSRIFNRAAELNHFTGKDIKELEKN